MRKSAQPGEREEEQLHPDGPAQGSEERRRAGRSRPQREEVCTAREWGEEQPRLAAWPGPAQGSRERWQAGRSRPRREEVCTAWGAGGVTQPQGRAGRQSTLKDRQWGSSPRGAPSSFRSASAQWPQRHPS